jgi:SAM-dependent methyltransferase
MHSAQFELHAEMENRHWWFLARRQIVRRLVREVVPPLRGMTVVDVGCGTGANIEALAGEYRCVGVDASEEAVLLARRRFPHLRFVAGEGPQALGSEIRRARLVLMMDVLEHVPDDFAFLSSYLAAAEPGTYFLLTVPADLALWSAHDVSFGHYRRYDIERLRAVWAGLPVEAVFTSYFNSRLYPLVRMSRLRSQRRGRPCGSAGTDFTLPRWPVNRALQSIFAGESRRLVRLARGTTPVGYRQGVSLMALLRRGSGTIEERVKPVELAADYWDPVAAPFADLVLV